MVIYLLLKFKLGLYGNWVDNKDIEEWKVRREVIGDVGFVKVVSELLLW